MASQLNPGDKLHQGRYQINRLINTGGMGAIFLAVDTHLGNQIAIKENFDPSPEAQRQFKAEAQILANLQHPVLPRVTDHFIEPSGRQYLIMDYVPGQNLEDILDNRGPLSENEVIPWMLEVCQALKHMHGQSPPIIHRDIKPANIKLTPDGRIALVDFGIAKVHQQGQKTQLGAQAVTAGFSPPEQYGEGTNERSDIYALGATMYCLLTGVAPEESIIRSPSNPLTSPRSINGAISKSVEKIILKAMAMKQEQRHQRVEELERALRPLVQPGVWPLPAVPVPPPTSLSVSCPHCGATNRSGATFCGDCGGPLAGNQPVPQPLGPAVSAHLVCPNGHSNRPGSRFCRTCGTQIPSTPPPTGSGVVLYDACPNCHASVIPGEHVCLVCGYVLQPAPLVSPVVLPTPIPAPQPQTPHPVQKQEHKQAAWALLGLGFITLLAALFWPGFHLLGEIWILLAVIAGVLAILSARDLLDLAGGYKYQVHRNLEFLFGDSTRGRRLGVVSAIVLTVLFIGQSWLLLPLAIVIIGGYTAKILMSEDATVCLGGAYERPTGVSLIGWGLAMSGIGTVPGVALLTPQPWAKRAADYALIALACLAGLIALIALLIVVDAISLPLTSGLERRAPLNLLGGMSVPVYALTGLSYAVAVAVASVMALRYLRDPGLQFSFTPSAINRKRMRLGWALLGTGLLLLVGPYTIWPAPVWGVLPRAVLLIPAILCLVAGRDLLQLFQHYRSRLRTVLQVAFGTEERGRRLGIVAALLTVVVLVGMAWLIIPLGLAFLMAYVAWELMDQPAVPHSGISATTPTAVRLTAWLLMPTGIGTIPGMGMLGAKPWSRKAGVGALALLIALALLVGTLTVYSVVATTPFWTYVSQSTMLPIVGFPAKTRALSIISYAVVLSVCSGVAIHYFRSPAIRSHFGA